MGLLSDPTISGTHNRLTRTLDNHCRKIGAIFYLAGLIWFTYLADPSINHNTYLSENALSPGLVYPEMRQEAGKQAQNLVEELQREREKHPLNMPVSWLVAKMKQIGLETHVHNFTLRYPFEGGREYHGYNVYGILRAPRIGSTEGVVYTAPYRSGNSVHTDITASVPTLLAFAEFARTKNYWAKDLIFLVTEQEQLGMYAWLEAYHKGGLDDDPQLLRSGNLPARAGALQAAINIEVQDLDFEFVNVKIEGLNGQLPNLDLFNLVQRITAREGIVSGYQATLRKQRQQPRRNSNKNGVWESNLKQMLSMLLSQAPGVPTGNHGLFHRYRIEALTLEAVKRVNPQANNRLQAGLTLLKTLEGISRSLNNLLERFHQSFFFYILVQNDRFVSIGDFMPCLALLLVPLFIKAFLLWLRAFDGKHKYTTEQDTSLKPALLLIASAFSLALICNILPSHPYVRDYFATLGVSASQTIISILGSMSLISLLLPFVIKLSDNGVSIDVLHITALLALGITLVVIGLLNFALGFLLSVICVPLSILIDCESGRNSTQRAISKLYAFLLNPLIVIYVLVFLLTLPQFPELTFKELLLRALNATMDAITFSLMDCIIYGNWMYRAVTALFLPIWTLHWTLTYCYQQKSSHNDNTNELESDNKENHD